MRQCMGGFCHLREKCAHYYAKPIPWLPPADKLCEKGAESPLKQVAAKELAK